MVDGTPTRIRAALLLALVPLLGACHYVKRDDMDDALAQMRQQMQEGDQGVETRLNARMDTLQGRLTALQRDLNALSDKFDVTVERLETSLRVTPPVHFAFDDATLDAAADPVLDRFAQLVKKEGGGALVTVEGFTDPAGSRSYNQALGLRRAEAVRHYLVESAGLSPDAVRAVSYGESTDRQVRPGAAGPGRAGRENRRVALVVDYAGQAEMAQADGDSPGR